MLYDIIFFLVSLLFFVENLTFLYCLVKGLIYNKKLNFQILSSLCLSFFRNFLSISPSLRGLFILSFRFFISPLWLCELGPCRSYGFVSLNVSVAGSRRRRGLPRRVETYREQDTPPARGVTGLGPLLSVRTLSGCSGPFRLKIPAKPTSKDFGKTRRDVKSVIVS